MSSSNPGIVVRSIPEPLAYGAGPGRRGSRGSDSPRRRRWSRRDGSHRYYSSVTTDVSMEATRRGGCGTGTMTWDASRRPGRRTSHRADQANNSPDDLSLGEHRHLLPLLDRLGPGSIRLRSPPALPTPAPLLGEPETSQDAGLSTNGERGRNLPGGDPGGQVGVLRPDSGHLVSGSDQGGVVDRFGMTARERRVVLRRSRTRFSAQASS